MKRDCAVIVGGGFAGMLSAAMLARYFKQVIIVEKFSQVSMGVAQSHHLHVLLKQGQIILERYFSGILDEMRQLGCKEIDWAADTVWYSPFGVYPRFRSGIVTVNCSRFLLDRLMYQRLLTIPNITFKYGTNDESNADFFVDARGRNADIADLKSTQSTIISNDLSYATQFYKLPDHHFAPFKQIYLPVYVGINDRGCVISPIEENKIVVTLIGRKNARPSKSQEEFSHHLAKLKNHAIIEYLQEATPVSNIKLFTDLSNEHRHLSKVKHWPRNVVALGDAVCKINPIYGQGMMLASKQVALLEKHLVNDAHLNTRLIQRKIDKIITFSWLMATTEDKRAYQNKNLGLRILHFCLDRLYQLCVRSEKIHLKFLRKLHGISI